MRKGFASDNNSGIHPSILQAIENANEGHAIGYGDDSWSDQAIACFKIEFGEETEVFFVFNGTGANVVGLSSVLSGYHAIICAQTAHISTDECAAPEKLIGCKLIPIPTPDGKLTPEMIRPHLHGFGFEHHAQPKVISISQVTEMGTIYKPQEIENLAQLAHDHGMFLHIDGARISNAAVTLNLPFCTFTRDCGADILSFGGTKNGMLSGEAVVFFNPALTENTKYIRKQSMQLFSKMRFISAQFTAFFKDELWKKNALHANRMAKLLETHIKTIPQIRITQPVEANAVFAAVPAEIIEPLRKRYFFYTWDELTSEVRWMTSFDTSEEEIEDFVGIIRQLIS